MTIAHSAALWWAVFVCCHCHCHASASHATAEGLSATPQALHPRGGRMLTAYANHHSTVKPYARFETRNNTSNTAESTSLPYASATIPSTLSPTWTQQDDSPSSPTFTDSVSIVGSSYVGGLSTAASTDHDVVGASSTRAEGSDGIVAGGTIIASITTVSQSPSRPNSTTIAFPTLSPSIPNNVTRTRTGTTTTTTSATTHVQWTGSLTTAFPNATTLPLSTDTEEFCTSTNGPFSTVIEYSIIYTWTITWFGDPADYTPPFPTISAPKPCTATGAPGRSTVSVCDSSGHSCSLITVEPTRTSEPWWVWITDTSEFRGTQPTLTFVTTDKNPAVVFPTSLPPDYGGTPDPVGNYHSAAHPNQAQSSNAPGYGSDTTTKQDVKSAPIVAPPVTVIVKPSVVVINDQTFTNDPAQPSSTVVVVEDNTFTIDPTQVVGVDATITRWSRRSETSPQPTETTIGGIEVSLVEGSSIVVIDKTSMTIGSSPSKVIVRDQTITIGPGAVVFPSQTLVIPAAPDTTQVVFGAELITAIGSDKVVIDASTITYGPVSSTVTEIIDEDTILVGPSGIIAHGTTYGGSYAASAETQFAVVGGVTISQIGSATVVIQGVTHALDQLVSSEATTTVIGGETVTIGPRGVAIETWTLDPPQALTTTITPKNAPAAAVMPTAKPTALPTATATATATVTATSMTENADEKNGCSSLASERRCWLYVAWLGLAAYLIA